MSLELEKIQVDGVSSTTLIGSYGDFPRARGNCFSVYREEVVGSHGTAPRRDFRVLNFNLENLEHLIEIKLVQWPIDILVYENHYALIHDKRIPDEYYQKHFCEVCCPEDLLPMPQRLALDRMILRGEREIIKTDDGLRIEKRKINVPTQKIDPDFKFSVAPDMVNLVGLDVEAEMTNAIMEQMVESAEFQNRKDEEEREMLRMKRQQWFDPPTPIICCPTIPDMTPTDKDLK